MTMRFWRRWLAVLACLTVLAVPMSTLAAPGLSLEASMGYEGAITYVRRLPITVRVQNDGPDVEGRVAVDVNRSEREFDRYEMPLSVASGASVQVVLPVVLTQRQKQYTVSFLRDGEILAQTTVQPEGVINPMNLIVGVLGEQTGLMRAFTLDQAGDTLVRGEYWKPVALTPEIFPSDVEGLRFFDMLAVEGVDLSALSADQQQALDEWLRAGGILWVGGGARATETFGFFTKYTGITAGALTDGGDVGASLLKLFSVSGAGTGNGVMLSPLVGAGGMSLGEEPLADITRVEGGYVMTTAFGMSEKPFCDWMAQNVIAQRILLRFAQGAYRTMVNQRSSGSYQSGGDSVNTGATLQIGVPNGRGMIWPMLVLALFIVLAGFGGYALLRRLDKREWMWLSVPVLALAASLTLWGLSGVLNLRDPIAVHCTNVLVDQDGQVSGYTSVSVARAERDPLSVSVDEGEIDLPSTLSYYMPSDSQEQEAAAKLRMTYTYGAHETLTVPSEQGWKQLSFLVRGAYTREVANVSGVCAWEGDDLVFTLTNGSSLALSEGAVFSDYGFVSVPELLPGQTVRCVLRAQPSAAAASQRVAAPQVTAPLTPVAQPSAAGGRRSYEEIMTDGVMLTEQERRSYSIYDFPSACFEKRADKAKTEEERREWRLVRNSLVSGSNCLRYDTNSAQFVYVAFCDDLDSLTVRIDGQLVDRAAQRGCVAVRLAYQPIADDGSVHFIKGSFPVSTATLDDALKPIVGEALSESYSQNYPLSTNPAFAFDVSAIPEGMTPSAFDIAPRYNYSSYKLSLYNVQTGAWDEFKRVTVDPYTGQESVSSVLPRLENYMKDGWLFARFEAQGKVDQYASVPVPALTLEGRAK